MPVDRFHLAGGQFEVVAQERRLDIRDGEVARGERTAVDPYPHCKRLRADHIDIGHPVEGREPIHHETVDIVGDFGRGHAIRRDGDAHHGVGIGIALDDLRLVRLFRQVATYPAYGIAHVIGGHVDIDTGFKLDGDAAAALTALGTDGANAGY